MLLVFFEDCTESANNLRFVFIIRFFILFLYFLYSGHSFRCLNLSRNLQAPPISGTYQTGRQEDFTCNAPIATKVVCFSRLLKSLRSLYGKQCGPRSDCSYIGAVCSGSTLFASILNTSVMLHNYLQQTT